MSEVTLYLLSFFSMLTSETVGILRDFCVIHNNKFFAALANSVTVVLWCVKIIVVIDEPVTVVTSAVGGFIGVYLAFYINGIINKKA